MANEVMKHIRSSPCGVRLCLTLAKEVMKNILSSCRCPASPCVGQGGHETYPIVDLQKSSLVLAKKVMKYRIPLADLLMEFMLILKIPDTILDIPNDFRNVQILILA